MGARNSATIEPGVALAKHDTKPVLHEFQFLVTPILLQVEDGKVPRPVQTDPKLLTGLEELRAFIDLFPAQLDELNAQQ